MKSFLTILLLSSAIFALIDETPAVEAVPESQKTDLVINMDQLKGLSHSHRRTARKAKQTHSRNRKAGDDNDSSTISFDVNEFKAAVEAAAK